MLIIEKKINIVDVDALIRGKKMADFRTTFCLFVDALIKIIPLKSMKVFFLGFKRGLTLF